MEPLFLKNWFDVIFVVLYNGKGEYIICDHNRGINWLETVGKKFARHFLKRLFIHVFRTVIPDVLSSFSSSRNTTNIIFSARQI